MAANWTSTLIPTDDELIPDLPGEHRAFKEMVRAVLNKEHATLSGDNLGCEHKPGSAVMWALTTANIPALDVEGNALASTDNGRMWHDLTTDIVYVLDDYADPTVAGGWVAMGHYLGDIAINTNKFTVARATGNTAVAGTLGVTGVATVAKGSLLASSDAPTTDAMVANKKYVDDQIVAEAPNANSLCKAWAKVSSGGAKTAGYNVTSTSKTATGKYTVTWDTDFSSANYAVIATAQRASGGQMAFVNIITQAAGSVTLEIGEQAYGLFDKEFYIAAFGAQ